MNEDYWETFYQNNAYREMITQPSSFAKFLLEESTFLQDKSKRLIDIGCGNGRDTFFFLNHNVDAYGLDSCATIIHSNQLRLNQLANGKERFFKFDVLNLWNEPKINNLNFELVYSRFFLHAINEKECDALFKYFSKLTKGGIVALEFRTDKDPLYLKSNKLERNLAKTTHLRNFLNFKTICLKIENANYQIQYQIEQDNLSTHNDDNPVLGRIIAVKRS